MNPKVFVGSRYPLPRGIIKADCDAFPESQFASACLLAAVPGVPAPVPRRAAGAFAPESFQRRLVTLSRFIAVPASVFRSQPSLANAQNREYGEQHDHSDSR